MKSDNAKKGTARAPHRSLRPIVLCFMLQVIQMKNWHSL